MGLYLDKCIGFKAFARKIVQLGNSRSIKTERKKLFDALKITVFRSA